RCTIDASLCTEILTAACVRTTANLARCVRLMAVAGLSVRCNGAGRTMRNIAAGKRWRRSDMSGQMMLDADSAAARYLPVRGREGSVLVGARCCIERTAACAPL